MRWCFVVLVTVAAGLPAFLLGRVIWPDTPDSVVVLDELGVGGPGEPGWITDPDELRRLLEWTGCAGAQVTADARLADLVAMRERADELGGTLATASSRVGC